MSCKCNHRCKRRFENPVKVSTHHHVLQQQGASEQWWIATTTVVSYNGFDTGVKSRDRKNICMLMPCEENIVEICGSSSLQNAYMYGILIRPPYISYSTTCSIFFCRGKNIYARQALCCRMSNITERPFCAKNGLSNSLLKHVQTLTRVVGYIFYTKRILNKYYSSKYWSS